MSATRLASEPTAVSASAESPDDSLGSRVVLLVRAIQELVGHKDLATRCATCTCALSDRRSDPVRRQSVPPNRDVSAAALERRILKSSPVGTLVMKYRTVTFIRVSCNCRNRPDADIAKTEYVLGICRVKLAGSSAESWEDDSHERIARFRDLEKRQCGRSCYYPNVASTAFGDDQSMAVLSIDRGADGPRLSSSLRGRYRAGGEMERSAFDRCRAVTRPPLLERERVPAGAQEPCTDNGADHDREPFKNRLAPEAVAANGALTRAYPPMRADAR